MPRSGSPTDTGDGTPSKRTWQRKIIRRKEIVLRCSGFPPTAKRATTTALSYAVVIALAEGDQHEGTLERAFALLTNLRNKGLISADRRTKPTLMLTIPRSIFKSSTKDLSLPTFEIAMEYDARPKPIVMRVTSGEVNIVAFQHGF